MNLFMVIPSIVLIVVLFPTSEQQSCPYYLSGTSQNEINQIVNIHNNLRNQISQGIVAGQPKGTNLQTMQWDNCLASEAQRLANLCQFKHATPTCSTWSWIGQNIYWSGSTQLNDTADWNSAILGWFSEYKSYTYPSNPNSTTGHYTQVVWANTNRVGCGYLSYQANSTFKYQKLYFCNYGPGGNILGQAPYST